MAMACGTRKRKGSAIRRWVRCRRGATAVEFALIMPVFLMVVLGIIEVGRAMWIRATLQYACEEASRYVLVRPSLSTSDAVTQAQSVYSSAGLANQTVTFTATEDTAGSTTFMTISASQNFTPLVPFIGLPTWTLTASSRVPRSD